MSRHILCYLLVIVGFLQMLGYLTNQKWLRGIGVLTNSSPLPIVFTEVKGVETFAQDFFLEYSHHGNFVTIQLTPELYGKLQAPYNYRNVLGAAISYGPVLPPELWSPVLKFSFEHDPQLAEELGLPFPLQEASIRIKTRTADRNSEWRLDPNFGEIQVLHE